MKHISLNYVHVYVLNASVEEALKVLGIQIPKYWYP